MTLPVSRLINVSINLAPLAAQGANLNALLILGSSNVVDVGERMKAYATIEEVAADFGTEAPEYLAALLYFEQSPQPQDLFIGRWAETATNGLLKGGILSAEEQLYDFTTITAGSMTISIDGDPFVLTDMDFSLVENMNGVAQVLQDAIGVLNATVTWDGERFRVQSATTGGTSTVSFATDTGSEPVASIFKLTSEFAAPPVAGIAAETPVECVAIFLDRFSTQFFGLMFADVSVTADQHKAVSALIEADQLHIYGITYTNTNALDSSVTNDLGSQLKDLSRKYTVIQYSTENDFAIASLFGRAFSVNFLASLTTITLMYKQEPGIVPETLSTSQANVLQDKRYNVFVRYNNDTAIVQYGTMCGPAYFDEIHNLAWLRNDMQTGLYNLLFTSTTKVPQTDSGNALLANVVEQSCSRGVNNGMIAPGQWNAGGFGTLKQGDFLPKGYYVFVPSITSQSQADREARKSVPIQVAVKLAGAVHTVDVTINVNR